ncbi:MAG: gamma-glutamyltransferase, partial [Lacisediminimonas sp.]|nr:gamma-glutamyltransferase [Lacisediminimonas sp.]
MSSASRIDQGAVSQANGKRAAVASGDRDAANAALKMLSGGGSVADAAIAASAVLCVTMPHATSIGGDAFFLIRDGASGTVHALNASGTAPSATTAETFADGMHQRGALAPVVPGLVKGWEALHHRFGREPWSALLADAVALAADSATVSPSLAQTILASERQLRQDPGCAALFFRNTVPLVAGERLQQAALAGTLHAIARLGADELFNGATGQALAANIASAGGLLRHTDLQQYSAEWVQPVQSRLHGHEISVAPPNSYGILMLMQLQALAGIAPDRLLADTASRMTFQMRCMRATFDVALKEIGDPRDMKKTIEQLLDTASIEKIHARMAAMLPDASPVPGGGTACVTVADASGNAVCIVQSIFNPFGSHYLDPQTGVLLNNRMFGFDHVPGRVNSIAPGKRSAHTLNPVIVTKAGKLRWVYASPGGISQTVTGTQIMMNLI